jgi:DNA-binding NtrC family response regulator
MTAQAIALVVENDTMRRHLLQSLAPRFNVLVAGGWTQALDIIAHDPVDIVVADLNLASHSAASLNTLSARAGSIPVVLVGEPSDAEPAPGTSGDPSAPLFVGRPVPSGDLPRALDDALRDREPKPTVGERSCSDEGTGILAESPAMRRVTSLIDRAARRDTPILLVGESGTGKELLARAVHKKSPRAQGPFVAVNCSAIPETLLESELFGHRRGAFTDARENQRGLFQSANHGTIFLDEIGDMASALQGKLLRVLQEREVHPLGAPAPVPVDVRIVTATHRDLDALLEQGLFRQDLLYRINVVEIWVPPLRDRPEDFGPLVTHLLDKIGARLEKPGCTISADAMGVLSRHTWPGNVRELENVIERALVLGNTNTIGVEDLPDRLTNRVSSVSGRDPGRRLAEVEREHIVRTLRAVAGNKAAAARTLGVNRKTLYRKLRQHRISFRA